MYTKVNMPKETDQGAVANTVGQPKRNGIQNRSLTDNRPKNKAIAPLKKIVIQSMPKGGTSVMQQVQAKTGCIQRMFSYFPDSRERGYTTVTKDAGSSVADTGAAIMGAHQGQLASLHDLNVYVGYHGVPGGGKHNDFTPQEMNTVNGIGAAFPNATIVDIRGSQPTEQTCKQEMENGNVFFTWCWSTDRIRPWTTL